MISTSRTSDFQISGSAISSHKNIHSIDFIKGILIILVFFGHLICGNQRTTFLRYIIYSFHMPIFIGISGFLFNIKKKPKEMIKYYLNRIVIPWCIAVLGYYFVNIAFSGWHFSFREVLRNFVFPWYHLWFVLGLLSYIIFTYIGCNLKIKRKGMKTLTIVIIAAFISLVSQWDLFGNLKNTGCQGIYSFLRVLQLNKLVFFVFGFYLRQIYEQKGYLIGNRRKGIMIVCSFINIFVTVAIFPYQYVNLEKVLLFTLNIPLLYWVLDYGLKAHTHKCRIIEWMGVYSYPLYLYHILACLLGQVLAEQGSVKYYMVGSLGGIGLCIGIALLKENKLLARFVFGIVRKDALKIKE